METSYSLTKDLELDPGQDFSFLLKVAVDTIKDIAGDSWTDYNEHDPGITILEQLAYALTEIGTKAALDVNDLICTENGSIDGVKNLFFPAAEILTSCPLTINDYRKVLLDSFPGINNVWIELHDDGYLINVDLKVVLNQEKGSKFKEDLLTCLNYCRNLSEKFYDVVILKPISVGIKGIVYLAEQVEMNTAIEDILLCLNEFISPVVPTNTVDELLHSGTRAEDIFSGPRSHHGYIMEEGLHLKNQEVRVNDLLRTIMSIAGVESVPALTLYKTTDLTDNEAFSCVPVSKTEVAVLDVRYTLNNLQFFVGNYAVSPPKEQLISNYYSKKHTVKSPFLTLLSEDLLDIPIPSGTFYNTGRYYSIKNHFPYIYGLDKQSSLKALSSQRQSQVLQLKGYLSFFEQHMANTLAQLSNAVTLFNLQAESTAYFVQSVTDYVDMNTILEEGYLEKQRQFMNRRERVVPRISLFKNHIFARFGEVLIPCHNTASLDQKDPVHPATELELIKSLPAYSSQKARAPQYLSGDETITQIEKNGLEIKLGHLLGLNNGGGLKNKSLFVVEHCFLQNKPAAKNLEADFYVLTVSYILLTNAENIGLPVFSNYVIETISRSSPAHLLCNIIIMDRACENTAGVFKKLFIGWVKQKDKAIDLLTEDEEELNSQLSSFIFNA